MVRTIDPFGMAARKPLPPELDGRAFNVRHAQQLGVTHDRLRSADLSRPFHGSRMPTRLPDLSARCAALQSVLPEDSAFVGPTAARLLGFPLPRRLESDQFLHVSTTVAHRSTRQSDTVGSRRPTTWTVDNLDGLRVVGRTEVWISLAGHLSPEDLTAGADFLLGPDSPGDPALTLARMHDALMRAGSARGVRSLRWSLADAREGVRSRPETHLRLLVRDVGPREPDVAAPIPVGGGRFVHPDLSWPEFRVAMEYDGAGHRDPRQHAIDVARHEDLVDEAWSVMHVVASDLYGHPSSVVAMLLRRLRTAGWLGGNVELTRFGRFEV